MAKTNNNNYVWRNLDLSYLKSGIYYDEAKGINSLDVICEAWGLESINVSSNDTIVKIVGEKRKEKRLIIENGSIYIEPKNKLIRAIKVKQSSLENKISLMSVGDSDDSNSDVIHSIAPTAALSGEIMLYDLPEGMYNYDCYLRKGETFLRNVWDFMKVISMSSPPGDSTQIISKDSTYENIIQYKVPSYYIDGQSLNGWGMYIESWKSKGNYKYDKLVNFNNWTRDNNPYKWFFIDYKPYPVFSSFNGCCLYDHWIMKFRYWNKQLIITFYDLYTSRSEESTVPFDIDVDKLVLYVRKPSTAVSGYQNDFLVTSGRIQSYTTGSNRGLHWNGSFSSSKEISNTNIQICELNTYLKEWSTIYIDSIGDNIFNNRLASRSISYINSSNENWDFYNNFIKDSNYELNLSGTMSFQESDIVDLYVKSDGKWTIAAKDFINNTNFSSNYRTVEGKGFYSYVRYNTTSVRYINLIGYSFFIDGLLSDCFIPFYGNIDNDRLMISPTTQSYRQYTFQDTVNTSTYYTWGVNSKTNSLSPTDFYQFNGLAINTFFSKVNSSYSSSEKINTNAMGVMLFSTERNLSINYKQTVITSSIKSTISYPFIIINFYSEDENTARMDWYVYNPNPFTIDMKYTYGGTNHFYTIQPKKSQLFSFTTGMSAEEDVNESNFSDFNITVSQHSNEKFLVDRTFNWKQHYTV